MTNYEKLCGKNGELVEFRQKQVLLGAAEIIKNYCRKNSEYCNKKDKVCLFQRPLKKKIDDLKYYCELDCPLGWELTTEKTDDFTE